MSPTKESSFDEVKTKRVFEEICQQIRDKLASGALVPGDKLPAERDMALEFKVSRPAVREALRTLEMSGVVSLHKGAKGGARIRDGNPALLTQSLQDLMLVGRVSIQDLVESRKVVLTAVIELACKRATDADFTAIEETIDLGAATEDMRLRVEAGARFFRLIGQATRNEVLSMLVDSLGEIMRNAIDKVGRVPRPELIGVRRRILKALRARDSKAAIKSMNQYLTIVHSAVETGFIDVVRPGRAAALARGANQLPNSTGSRKSGRVARAE